MPPADSRASRKAGMSTPPSAGHASALKRSVSHYRYKLTHLSIRDAVGPCRRSRSAAARTANKIRFSHKFWRGWRLEGNAAGSVSGSHVVVQQDVVAITQRRLMARATALPRSGASEEDVEALGGQSAQVPTKSDEPLPRPDQCTTWRASQLAKISAATNHDLCRWTESTTTLAASRGIRVFDLRGQQAHAGSRRHQTDPCPAAGVFPDHWLGDPVGLAVTVANESGPTSSQSGTRRRSVTRFPLPNN